MESKLTGDPRMEKMVESQKRQERSLEKDFEKTGRTLMVQSFDEQLAALKIQRLCRRYVNITRKRVKQHKVDALTRINAADDTLGVAGVVFSATHTHRNAGRTLLGRGGRSKLTERFAAVQRTFAADELRAAERAIKKKMQGDAAQADS